MSTFKLKKITCGKKAKVIETTAGCFVLGLYSSDPRESQFSLWDSTKGSYLDPIFTDTDFINESYLRNYRFDNLYSQQENVFFRNPYQKMINIAQKGDYTLFTLLSSTLSGVTYKHDETIDWQTENNSIIKYKNGMDNNLADFFDLSSIFCEISGYTYNFLQWMPLDKAYYDLEDGINFGGSTKTKNMYDWNFNTNISYNANTSAYTLDNNRSYYRIGTNNGDIWLSYKANRQLSATIEEPISGITYGKITNDKNINTTNISNYEFIDRFKQINKFKNSGLHKSNIFSIRIKDSGLNEVLEAQYGTDKKQQIQTAINNVIKNMTRNVVPTHTQLWKIEWKGE